MSPRSNNTLWFAIPALATAGVVTAISIPGLEETRQAIGTDTLTEPIIALVLLAGTGGAVVGGLCYVIRRLATRTNARRP